MPAIARFETLEELRPLIFLLSQKLESQFIGAHFPLETTTYESANNCIKFHRELAHGYDLVSLDRSFADPIYFNDLLRARTLHRALQSYGLVIFRQGLLYQTRSFDSWREVYALYSLAEQYEIEKVRVKDNETKTKSNVGDVFKCILLFTLSETYHHQQHDILHIYNFLSHFSRYVALQSADSKDDGNIASHYFKLDSDEPPRRLADGKTIVDNGCYRYLSTQPMMRLIGEQPVPSTASDNTLATHTLVDAAIKESILQRIMSLQKRKYTRFTENTNYKLIFSLDHLIAVFSNIIKARGQSEKSNTTLDLDDGFEQKHLEADEHEKVNRSNSAVTAILDESKTRVSAQDIWTTEANHTSLAMEDIIHVYDGANSSATGYCLIHSQTNSSKIKVGDLVGVYEEKSKINIGLICWLEYSHNEALSFGIKLLSPEAKVVEIGVLDNLDIAYTETELSQFVNTNALFLPAFPAAKKPISLLTPPLLYEVGNWIVLKTENENKVYRLKRLLDSSSAVSHFEIF